MKRAITTLGIFGALVAVGACTGTIGGGGDDGGDNDQTVSDALCVVDTPLRRLTRFEYNNTVRDLLGDDTQPANVLPPEEEVAGFNNQAAALTASLYLAEKYHSVAEGISERATQDLPALLDGCDHVADADGCINAFISDFGRRAYRRPLSDDEKSALRALYDESMADPEQGTFEEAVQLVIQAVLQSPHFLYRPEFGGDTTIPKTDIAPLTDWEIATKLSYMLWNTMPDDTLFAAAEAGELHTKEQVEAQARRMLDDDRAKDAIRNFHTQWLLLSHLDTLSKDAGQYPQYHDGMRDLWAEEIQRFIEYVILEDDGSLQTLLTADYSFLNDELAALYGDDVVGSTSGTELVKTELDPNRRSGLLTQGALLATLARGDQSSPVYRGKFVREQLLCQSLPLPPANLVIEPPELDSTKTTREQFEEIGNNPDCASCHNLMNPIGFIFEHYDGIGLWRDTQNGKPIDATGDIIQTEDLDGLYDGAIELAQAMAESEQVASCVGSQWFRFSYNRSVTPEDACNVEQIGEAFAASGYNIKELLVALTQTNTFLMRHRIDPDAVPEQSSDQGGEP